MTKPMIPRKEYDHPEHFRDIINEHETSERNIPTHLGDLLYELSEFKCSICKEPRLDIHHIEHLRDGGKTTLSNLIVLCPNCHRRVHDEGIPNSKQLYQCRMKQDIAYELPIFRKLSSKEKEIIKKVSLLPEDDQVNHSESFYYEIETSSQDDARMQAGKRTDCSYLLSFGIFEKNFGNVIKLADSPHIGIQVFISITAKGFKWIQYLVTSERIGLIDSEEFQ
ncbi:MAG: HNH endonuclease [Magnetococcales bacterium]|nr:HNH endonuclease [Magnetococcales bacterium]